MDKKMVKMDKIHWCCRQKDGIKEIEPNENLSDRYIEESNQTLESIGLIKNKWNLIMGYYTCYNAPYSILMKIGIKCEIHDCSIELMNVIPGFSEQDILFMKRLKEDRISVQYYLKDKTLKNISEIKDFVLKCKQIREELNINKIRNELSKLIKGDKN